MSDTWNPNTLIGTQLGSCVLERPLGVGGMSAVYLARQLRPRRQVAVKLLRPGLSADPRAWASFLARFRREADATAALDSANIVPIYEFGEEGDIAYLVMPYLADGSLASLLAREGHLPLPQALAYLEQAGAALDVAHRHGIIHRDVKPSNLLLHPDGRLLLADFGIARPLDSEDLAPIPGEMQSLPRNSGITIAGMAMGTPDYMAPEQVRGEPVSPATDIYALATVGYTMLAGHTPFGGGETADVLSRQVHERPRPLHRFNPDVPPHVEDTIQWALAKDASDRPSSVATFLHALSGGHGHRPDLGSRSGVSAPSNKRPRTLGAFGRGIPPVPALAAPDHRSEGDAATRSDPFATSIGPGDDATIADAGFGLAGAAWGGGRTTGGLPVWPGSPQPPQSGGDASRRGRTLPLSMIVAGVVLAFVLVVVTAFAAGSGALSGGGPNNQLGALLGQATNTPQATPTATATPLPTPTFTPVPPANWLTVSPDSITLACKGHEKSAEVTLENQGPDPIGWTAQIDWTTSVSVEPKQGTIGAYAKQYITITDTAIFGGDRTLSFMPTSPDAGAPASLHYSVQGCFGGG